MGPAATILAASAAASVGLLGAGAVAAAGVRTRSAAARHLAWTAGVTSALAFPGLLGLAEALNLPRLQLPFVPSVGLAPQAALNALAGLPPGSDLAPGVVLTPLAALLPSPGLDGSSPTWNVLFVAWAVGSALAAVRLLRGHLAAWALVRAASPAPMEAWAAPLRAAHRSLGMRRPVELLRSPHLGSPVTVGALRPRILLPASATAWPEDRLYSVLLHELAHVRRHDAFVQLLAGLATVAYWWNPLAWLAARRLRAEREDACDDLVLAAGVLPSAYATDLLAVARAILTPAPLGAVPAAGCTGTEARLRRILDPAVPRGAPSPALRLLVGLGAGALTTLAACARLPQPVESADAAVPAAKATVVPSANAPVATDEDEAVVLRADAPVVTEAIRRGLGDIDACFTDTRAGSITMHWTVDAVGTTVEACVTEDTTGEESVRQCVNDRLANGYFPSLADRTVEVTFPTRGG